MRDTILELIKQGKTKTDICNQLEITHQQFDKYLSIHNSNNYKNSDVNNITTINYNIPKEKGLLDDIADITKTAVGTSIGIGIFNLIDEDN